MDITPWVEKLAKEGGVIYDAPVIFVTAVVVTGSVIWLIIHLLYRNQLNAKEERIKLRDDQIGTLERKIKHLEGDQAALASLPTQEGPQVSEKSMALSAGIEFFPTIGGLRSRHPLSETVKPCNEIHAYFLSGEGIFAEHNDYIKYVKRLILPNPEAKTLTTFQTMTNS